MLVACLSCAMLLIKSWMAKNGGDPLENRFTEVAVHRGNFLAIKNFYWNEMFNMQLQFQDSELLDLLSKKFNLSDIKCSINLSSWMQIHVLMVVLFLLKLFRRRCSEKMGCNGIVSAQLAISILPIKAPIAFSRGATLDC